MKALLVAHSPWRVGPIVAALFLALACSDGDEVQLGPLTEATASAFSGVYVLLDVEEDLAGCNPSSVADAPTAEAELTANYFALTVSSFQPMSPEEARGSWWLSLSLCATFDACRGLQESNQEPPRLFAFDPLPPVSFFRELAADGLLLGSDTVITTGEAACHGLYRDGFLSFRGATAVLFQRAYEIPDDAPEGCGGGFQVLPPPSDNPPEWLDGVTPCGSATIIARRVGSVAPLE